MPQESLTASPVVTPAASTSELLTVGDLAKRLCVSLGGFALVSVKITPSISLTFVSTLKLSDSKLTPSTNAWGTTPAACLQPWTRLPRCCLPRRKSKYVQADLAAAAAAEKKPAPVQPAPEPWPRYLNLKQAAKYLGQSYFPVYRWLVQCAEDGKLLINKQHKRWTVDRLDLDRLWRECAQTAA